MAISSGQRGISSLLPDIRNISCVEEGRDNYIHVMEKVEHEYSCGGISRGQYLHFRDELEWWMREVELYCMPYRAVASSGRKSGKSAALGGPFWGMDLPAPPAKLETETTWGEIVAFRIWRVDRELKLRSSFTDHIWKPGKVMKADRKIKDYDRESNIKTGVHAWKSVFEVVEYVQTMFVHGDCMSGAVIGRVKLWGDVVEHQRGYRAEFARIESLDDCVTPASTQWEADHSTALQNGPDPRGVVFRLQRWNGELLEQLREIYFPKPKDKNNAATE